MGSGPPGKLYDAYIFDLDGTVYLGDTLLPTARETIAYLRSLEKRVLYLSNNPTHDRSAYAAKLTGLGLPTRPTEVLNSSYVLVNFLRRHHPSSRLFVMGESSICQELRAAGFELTEDARLIDVVIASFDRTFAYRKLQIAFDAIRAGARFFATNADRFCPVPGGGEPDAAAIIAAIQACTGVEVEAVVGKPSSHTVEAILELVQVPVDRCLIVGDKLETDVLMGLEAGMATALTLTGVTDEARLKCSSIVPRYVIRYLADLIRNPE